MIKIRLFQICYAEWQLTFFTMKGAITPLGVGKIIIAPTREVREIFIGEWADKLPYLPHLGTIFQTSHTTKICPLGLWKEYGYLKHVRHIIMSGNVHICLNKKMALRQSNNGNCGYMYSRV